MTYPEHIYDDTRINLASQLLEKEFLKLFPEVPAATFSSQIKRWRQDPTSYHLEDGIRDFWDIFAATLESIKLKPTFTALLTAENHILSREEVDPKNIILSSHLAQLQRLNLPWSDEFTVGLALANMDKEEMKIQKSINDSHSTFEQDRYPIIVRRENDGKCRVMDGNRRSLRAGLYNKPTIDAWVITMSDPLPQNYWVPIGDLFNLTKLYRLAKNKTERQQVRNTLEMLFRVSDVARISYRTRILKQSNPWADELYKLTPTLTI